MPQTTWKDVIELWISKVLSKQADYKAEEADAICQCILDMVKKNANVISSKIYCNPGFPLIGKSSFGITLDNGSKRVPKPAKGIIACLIM